MWHRAEKGKPVSPQIANLRGSLRTEVDKSLGPRKLHPLLEEKDPKNDIPKNYSFWTFAAHMTQIPPKKYNFTQFTPFLHFLFIKTDYYFV